MSRSDVISTYAGLRPLLLDKSDHPSRAPRNHKILTSSSGLLSITGGKLTTYRIMARQAVDKIVRRLGRKVRSKTASIKMFAAPRTDDPLITAYGTEAKAVRSIAGKNGQWSRPIVAGLPYLMAEALYAIRHERAVKLSDILSRRTRLILFAEGQARKEAEVVAKALAPETGWNTKQEIEGYEREIELHAGA